MIVLDADSLMSGDAIRNLSQALAEDPEAGLIQSFPTLVGAETLFGRVQQFSNAIYGWLLAEGLHTWAQREGNYWGHNAIIRTRAFAESARLPYLKGRGGRQDLILSHDFVEAGLLRRAGWSVKFHPRMDGSYEETPQTLIDYALRDRRWCQGNLQHLRILAASGFHPISRFHLLQGALSFLMSPACLAVIVLWSLLGLGMAETGSYFSPSNPLQPIWPDSQTSAGWTYLIVILVMLLLPKLLGTLVLSLQKEIRTAYGSGLRFAGSAFTEIVIAVVYAPIMMVQHTIAIVYAVFGRANPWKPQSRDGKTYGWAATLRFHWIETTIGAAMCVGFFTGHVSGLLLPFAASLVAAVPLSRLSSLKINRLGNSVLRLETPHSITEPDIVTLARRERARFKAVAANTAPEAIAAE